MTIAMHHRICLVLLFCFAISPCMSLGFDIYFVVIASIQIMPFFGYVLCLILPSSRLKTALSLLDQVDSMVRDISENGIAVDEELRKRLQV